FFSSRRRHTIFSRDWSSDVCSADLGATPLHRGPPSDDALFDQLPQLVVAQTELAENLSVVLPQGRGGTPESAGRVGQARDHVMQDRKSVVEGKSVENGRRRGVASRI